ncbi:MAG: hypothetical protein ACI82F_002652, partial [Planctomycetota bacterium]
MLRGMGHSIDCVLVCVGWSKETRAGR